jgi:ATP-dependent Clp protease, protease subunit
MGNFAFALAGDGTETLELDIYSVIGESFWFDSVSANYVRRRLKENSKAKLIKLRINSDGGDVFDAAAIYADLQDHPARVEATITGLAASAATLIAMAADSIRIAEGAWFMIHNAWGMATGSADKLESWAEVLRKTSATFADIYAKRSKLDRKKVVSLMDEETWMTAAEAKSFGFVDEVIAAKTKAAASAGELRALESVQRSVAGALASGDYSNLPETLRIELDALKKPSGEGGAPAQASVEVPPPAPPAPEPAPQLQLALEPSLEAEENPMSIPKTIILALTAFVPSLKLTEESDEASVVAGIKKLGASARAGASIEALVGVEGDAAVGAVRALKEANESNAKLADEVEKLKVVNARRDFSTLVAQGTKDKKLSPAQAKFYSDKFEKAVALEEGIPRGDGMDVVEDLRGFLAVSPRQGSSTVQQVVEGTNVGAAQHNGKGFETMTPAERLKLKRDNVDLYNTLRDDAIARGTL